MLKLKKLTFSNLNSFNSPQSIYFSNKTNLIQIDGKNLDTQGSSGSGKSSVCQAVDYLFNTNTIPASKLESRHSTGPLFVECEFEDGNGKEYTVKRHRKDGLSISGHVFSNGNSKVSEEELDKLIGMPRELFGNLIHKKQDNGGFFLNLTGKETYEFLIKCLGLESQITCQKKIDEDIKALKNKVDKSTDNVDFAKKSIQELDVIFKSQLKPIDSTNRDELNNNISTHSSLIKLSSALVLELATAMSEIKQPSKVVGDNSIRIQPFYDQISDIQSELNTLITERKSLELFTFQKRNELENTKSSIVSNISQISNNKTTIKSNMESINKIKIEINELNKQRCPTCLQNWVDENELNNKIKEHESQIASLTNEILSLKESILSEAQVKLDLQSIGDSIILINNTDYTIIDDKIKTANEGVFELKSKISNIDSEIDNMFLVQKSEYFIKIQEIKDKFEPNIKQVSDRAMSLELNYINPARNSILVFEKQTEQYLNSVGEIQTSIDVKNNTLLNLTKEFNIVKESLFIAEESKRLLKSYTMKIFEESLEQISFNANQIMFNTPNTSSMRIDFETTKEAKSGSIKDEVTPILTINDVPDIDIKTLSGGEKTAINIAVDLAVMDLIETKTGNGADFMFMDEPFGGLETVNIENIIRMIETSSNKRVIIIEHNPEAKQFIQDTITVVKENNISRIA